MPKSLYELSDELSTLRANWSQVLNGRPEAKDEIANDEPTPTSLIAVGDYIDRIRRDEIKYRAAKEKSEKASYLKKIVDGAVSLKHAITDCTDGKNFFNDTDWYRTSGVTILNSMEQHANAILAQFAPERPSVDSNASPNPARSTDSSTSPIIRRPTPN